MSALALTADLFLLIVDVGLSHPGRVRRTRGVDFHLDQLLDRDLYLHVLYNFVLLVPRLCFHALPGQAAHQEIN